jgi:ABC-type glycerol-3-phosphate transport system substrate-binding protein
LKTNKQIVGIGVFLAVALLYVVIYNAITHRPEKTIAEIHFADRVTEAHRILIDKYNSMHAGSVKVILIDFPLEDFSTDGRKEVLARSLRGEDDAIDLLAVDVIWVHRFAKWCEPLGKYFTDEERKGITATALRTCYHEGELVAVPLDRVQGVMYYREDLLKQFPDGEKVIEAVKKGITWPDFLKLKTRLNAKGPFYIFPAAEFEGLICSYIEILLSLRPNYFETVGFQFDTPEAKTALQLLVDLVHRYHVTPPVVSSLTDVPSFEYFIRNDGLFVRGWTSYDKDFMNAPIDHIKEKNLKKAPIPYLPEGKPTYVFGGWNLMMSKSSTKKEAVIDFVKFLLSDESQEIFYTKGGYCPVTNSFYNDSTYRQRYPEICIMKEMMAYGVYRPMQDNYTKYSKIMARYFYLAILGKISVEKALQSVQASIEAEGSQTRGR